MSVGFVVFVKLKTHIGNHHLGLLEILMGVFTIVRHFLDKRRNRKSDKLMMKTVVSCSPNLENTLLGKYNGCFFSNFTVILYTFQTINWENNFQMYH